MYYPVSDASDIGTTIVSLRCPNCRQIGSYQPLPGVSDSRIGGGIIVGSRSCPNPECLAHMFVIFNNQRERLASYPPERIDFNVENIPEPIIESFTEAITCHAHHCYVASAIMVRRTLEDLCDTEDCEGNNLHARLLDLGSKIVLPQALLDGLQVLRWLGNDAAHIESRTFEDIGQNELDIAIRFTKEVLKATYQYESLLGDLESLRAEE